MATAQHKQEKWNPADHSVILANLIKLPASLNLLDLPHIGQKPRQSIPLTTALSLDSSLRHKALEQQTA